MRSTGGEIIVGYNGSEGARRALRTACELASGQTVVTVIHAFDAPPHLAYVKSFEEACAKVARRVETSAREVVGSSEAEVHYLTVVGKPAEVLADEGRRRDAEIIVVGSRGLGPVRSLIGGVTQRLLRRASCPVLVVPELSDQTQARVPIRVPKEVAAGRVGEVGSAALGHN